MVYEEYVQGDLHAWNLLKSEPFVNGNVTWTGLDGNSSKWFRLWGVLKNGGSNRVYMVFNNDTTSSRYSNEYIGGAPGIRIAPDDSQNNPVQPPLQYMIDSYAYVDTSASMWHIVRTHVSYMNNVANTYSYSWMGYYNQTSTPITRIDITSASTLTGFLNLYEIAPTW